MPYITAIRRIALSDGYPAQSPGELNYLITEAIIRYCRESTLSYQVVNDVVGALEGAKLEFYRRVAAPYEDHKVIENGDVY